MKMHLAFLLSAVTIIAAEADPGMQDGNFLFKAEPGMQAEGNGCGKACALAKIVEYFKNKKLYAKAKQELSQCWGNARAHAVKLTEAYNVLIDEGIVLSAYGGLNAHRYDKTLRLVEAYFKAMEAVESDRWRTIFAQKRCKLRFGRGPGQGHEWVECVQGDTDVNDKKDLAFIKTLFSTVLKRFGEETSFGRRNKDAALLKLLTDCKKKLEELEGYKMKMKESEEPAQELRRLLK